MSVTDIDFGIYRTHEELHDAMKRLADAFPGLDRKSVV